MDEGQANWNSSISRYQVVFYLYSQLQTYRELETFFFTYSNDKNFLDGYVIARETFHTNI